MWPMVQFLKAYSFLCLYMCVLVSMSTVCGHCDEISVRIKCMSENTTVTIFIMPSLNNVMLTLLCNMCSLALIS